MSETSPLLTGSSPKLVRFRTAGFCILDQELNCLNQILNQAKVKLLYVVQMSWLVTTKTQNLLKTMFIDGWLRTGDLGHIDRDGYVEIRGRSKNMILTASGENIYPRRLKM
jgi:long-chain acyl-CoA synthetase